MFNFHMCDFSKFPVIDLYLHSIAIGEHISYNLNHFTFIEARFMA